MDSIQESASMLSLRGKRALASALVLVTGLCIPVQADEQQSRAAIAKLLDVGWGVTAQARDAADLQYEEVLRAAGRNPRALTASWLVLMQQRRYEEARKRLEEHLALAPDDLTALRAKTWILAVQKNYSAAMHSADKLSELVAAMPLQSDSDRAAQDESIGFLGRLLGFFGGPAAEAINQEERKALERKLLDRLDETRKAVFEDARNGVLSKFISMTDDSADAHEKAIAAAAADKKKTLAELQSDREQTAARSKELDSRKNKARDELRDELDQIARQDQPLVQDLARLGARANVLNADLAAYSVSIGRLQQLAAAEKDPVRKQQYLLEADQVSLLAAQADANLIGVNRLAQGVQAQRAALAARQQQAQNNASSQVKRIDNELGDLAKRDKRNDGLEKRAVRPVSGTTSKVRSISAQATALSTYDTFPLEPAKARLLESLQ
jgi:hypothetical protein